MRDFLLNLENEKRNDTFIAFGFFYFLFTGTYRK